MLLQQERRDGDLLLSGSIDLLVAPPETKELVSRVSKVAAEGISSGKAETTTEGLDAEGGVGARPRFLFQRPRLPRSGLFLFCGGSTASWRAAAFRRSFLRACSRWKRFFMIAERFSFQNA